MTIVFNNVEKKTNNFRYTNKSQSSDSSQKSFNADIIYIFALHDWIGVGQLTKIIIRAIYKQIKAIIELNLSAWKQEMYVISEICRYKLSRSV